MPEHDDISSRTVRAKVREFAIPPIQDGLVIGRDAPIGIVALGRAIQLLVASPFEQVEVQDDVIAAILVRRAILRRMPRGALVAFVLRKVKPYIGAEEILHFTLDAELTIEERGL
jgi:hypothetical protein